LSVGIVRVSEITPALYGDNALLPWRFALSLLGGLTGLAIVLTSIGLFAVVSYLVRERTKELGLREGHNEENGGVVRMNAVHYAGHQVHDYEGKRQSDTCPEQSQLQTLAHNELHYAARRCSGALFFSQGCQRLDP
jgi:hypothetical protein